MSNKNSNSKNWKVVGLGIAIVCVVIAYFIDIFKFPEPTDAYIFTLTILFPIVYGISLIFINNKIPSGIFYTFYSIPKREINNVVSKEIDMKNGAGFILISFIIIFLISYLFASTPIFALIGLLPGSDFFHDLENNCDSAIVQLENVHALGLTFLVMVGPLWLIILRKIQQHNNFESIRGSKSLISFLYAIIVIFVMVHFIDMNCEEIREPGIYAMPPSYEEVMFSAFRFAVFFGIPASLFVLIIEKWFVPKLKNN